MVKQYSTVPGAEKRVQCVTQLRVRYALVQSLCCALPLQYETVEEGMEATLDTYLSVLLQLISQRHLELFVHPIPPVLNETRPIVRPFNQVGIN